MSDYLSMSLEINRLEIELTEKESILDDAYFLVKHLIRKCKTLDEALNELTTIGLETDTREVFDFAERLRGFLCEKDERNKQKEIGVLRGTQGENGVLGKDKNRCNELDAENGEQV